MADGETDRDRHRSDERFTRHPPQNRGRHQRETRHDDCQQVQVRPRLVPLRGDDRDHRDGSQQGQLARVE